MRSESRSEKRQSGQPGIFVEAFNVDYCVQREYEPLHSGLLLVFNDYYDLLYLPL